MGKKLNKGENVIAIIEKDVATEVEKMHEVATQIRKKFVCLQGRKGEESEQMELRKKEEKGQKRGKNEERNDEGRKYEMKVNGRKG